MPFTADKPRDERPKRTYRASEVYHILEEEYRTKYHERSIEGVSLRDALQDVIVDFLMIMPDGELTLYEFEGYKSALDHAVKDRMANLRRRQARRTGLAYRALQSDAQNPMQALLSSIDAKQKTRALMAHFQKGTTRSDELACIFLTCVLVKKYDPKDRDRLAAAMKCTPTEVTNVRRRIFRHARHLLNDD